MAAPTYYFARSAHSGGQSITTASPAAAKQVAQGLANRVGGKVTLYKYTNGKPRKAGTFVGKVANPPRNKWVSGVVKNRAGKVVARGPIMVTSKGEIKAKKKNPGKWILPYKRGKKNYENVGYLPFALEHDIGFSGSKMYRPVKVGDNGSITVGSSELSSVDYNRYSRKSAIAAIKALAKK